MKIPEWTWRWAWGRFLAWRLSPALPQRLTALERWQVVVWSLWPGVKHHYLRPAEAWFHRHLPTAILLLRLRRRGADWYEVPSISSAIHLWRRLGVHVLEGDFVRIENGRATKKGFVDDDLCEFWMIDGRQ